jgi:nitrate/nitrite transporter NarK
LEKKTHSHGGKIDFSMIKDLNDGLIILCMGNLMLGSQSYFMFTQMSTECLIKRFGLTLEEAKNRLFLMPLLALIAIPFYSFLVGKYGKKTLWLLTGFAIAITSYVLMLILPTVSGSGENQNHKSTKTLLYISIFLLSQFRAIQGSVIWSSIALTSPAPSVSLAFGVALFLNNLAGASFPNILGAIIKPDTYAAFQDGILFVLLIACCGMVFCICLLITDKKRGGLLWHPENGDKVRLLKDKINQRAIDR